MILPESDTFIAKRTSLYPTAEGRVIAVDVEGGQCLYLDNPQAEVIEALSTPANLAMLEKRLIQRGWDSTFSEEVAGCIQELSRMNLIVKVNDLSEKTEITIDGPQYYPYLAWPTKNKPDELKRGLEAWALFFHDSDQKPGFIVSDDSDFPDNQTRTVLENIKKAETQDIYLLDRETRIRFAKMFPDELRQSVTFSLGLQRDIGDSKFGAYGANQNFILLLTAGSPVAMTDDDMVPELMRRHGPESNVTALYGGMDPTAIDVVKSWSDLRAIGSPVGREKYLRILGSRPGSFDLSLANMQAIKNVYAGNCSVAAVCFCHWGDPGTANASYLLANRRQINVDISDPDDYHHMMKTRLILKAPLANTLGGKAFMAGHCVYFPKPTVPPFSPLGRNQDGLWGLMLEKIQPGSMILYPDMAIKHEPINPKLSSREMAIEWRLGLNETLNLLTGFLATTSKPSKNQIVFFGRELENFCTGSRQFIREAISNLVLQSILGKKRMLLNALNLYGERPEWWAEDVHAAVYQLDKYVCMPNFWLPFEYRDTENEFVDYCRQFGLLLQAWPEIYEYSKNLGQDLLDIGKL